ncbi:hypothetical protein [Kaistella sp.]|uniref:hypothetical protein n=1 Tax=Kaistella sp. TaxID=2782235 RepID=UPI003C4578E6
MKKIDPQNKLCIYLDQFVISDILEGKNPLWIEIKDLLELNFSVDKIYCPLSVEHILETVGKNFIDAKEHDIYFRKISDNYILKSEPFLTAQLISSLIRNNKKTINTFLAKSSLKNMVDLHSKVNSDYNKFNNGMTQTLLPQNDLRKIINNKISTNVEAEMMNAIKAFEVSKFKDRLTEYVTSKSIRIRPDNFGEHKVPNWIDQLLYQLTYKHQFKEKEFQSLLKEIATNGFNRIPTLNIKFSLGAYIAIKNKQENSGDHIDVMRISSYLFSTDIFFTDKKRKHEICELGLDRKYNTLVFSGVKDDLLQFIDLLKKISS